MGIAIAGVARAKYGRENSSSKEQGYRPLALASTHENAILSSHFTFQGLRSLI